MLRDRDVKKRDVDLDKCELVNMQGACQGWRTLALVTERDGQWAGSEGALRPRAGSSETLGSCVEIHDGR